MMQSPMINLELAELRRTETQRGIEKAQVTGVPKRRSRLEAVALFLRVRLSLAPSSSAAVPEQPIEQPAG